MVEELKMSPTADGGPPEDLGSVIEAERIV
jgi:hypothetical protein